MYNDDETVVANPSENTENTESIEQTISAPAKKSGSNKGMKIAAGAAVAGAGIAGGAYVYAQSNKDAADLTTEDKDTDTTTDEENTDTPIDPENPDAVITDPENLEETLTNDGTESGDATTTDTATGDTYNIEVNNITVQQPGGASHSTRTTHTSHTTSHRNSQPVTHEEPKSSYLEENDVKITSIETEVDENGNIVHVAHGYVNGQEAIFIDDGQGNVRASVIDTNADGEVQATEISGFGNGEIKMGQLTEHMVRTEDIATSQTTPTGTATQTGFETEEPEVHVIAVENDVEFEGQIVDVAAVSIDDTPVVMIDTTQNGEADLIMADLNNNDELDEGETFNVTGQGIDMPTVDDMDIMTDGGDLTVNDLPDYSNDSDISVYDV